jgi:hypothetical protein
MSYQKDIDLVDEVVPEGVSAVVVVVDVAGGNGVTDNINAALGRSFV